MGVKLYSYQEDALNKLSNGKILCGGVGSGKSITSLAYYYQNVCCGDYKGLGQMTRPKPLYIITTARKRDSGEWVKECARFKLNDYTIDSWNNIKKYVEVKNSFFIFDEQRLVGNGAWVHAFYKIVKENKWILLSATPGDTWSDYIPVFIANGFYKNRTDFYNHHVVWDRFAKYPKVNRYFATGRLVANRRKILVPMRYQKKNKRHIKNVLVDYDKDIYNLALRQRWNPYTNEPIRDAGALCYILRKIVNSDQSRCDQISLLFKDHSRLIIFYSYDYELDLLHKLGQRLRVEYTEWNGHKHEEIPSTDKWLYFVQYTAGAEAWNCIETDTIIFYSLNYSYKMMEQASGRIDRINSPYTDLYYYRLISGSSIDKSVLHAIQSKQNFNQKAFILKNP